MSTAVIIHPCFRECQDFTLDQYWKDILFACACNKFPRGVRYDSSTGTLYVRTPSTGGKTKVEAIDLPEKPEEAYKVLVGVFRDKLGMYSSRDLQIKKKELDEIQNQRRVNMDCEWKKLKPRSIKDLMIMNYVSRMKEEHNLTPKEAKQLLSTIQLGFQFKELNSEDVEYADREIKSINGLEYIETERKWVITNPSKPVSKSEKTVTTQKFCQSIDRFLREYKSRRLRL